MFPLLPLSTGSGQEPKPSLVCTCLDHMPHVELVKVFPQFKMMKCGLFWLELDEDRWCHLLQVIPFQLALEPPFLVCLQFDEVRVDGSIEWG